MLNQASIDKLKGVKPELVSIIKKAAEKAPAFQIVQGNRTQAQQDALYAQGRTKPGKIVTWTRKSRHIGGGAIDFAALVNGKISWDTKLYPAIASQIKAAAKALGYTITWGGDWKTKDWGHIQLEGKAMAEPTTTSSAPQKTAEAPSDWAPRMAYDMFKEAGWSRVAALALVANIMWESGGNAKDTIVWNAVGDSGKSHTSLQINGSRWAEYQKFAASQNKAWDHGPTQILFALHELKTTEKKAATRLTLAQTIDEAVAAAITYWRPSIPHADKRLAIAKRLEQKIPE